MQIEQIKALKGTLQEKRKLKKLLIEEKITWSQFNEIRTAWRVRRRDEDR